MWHVLAKSLSIYIQSIWLQTELQRNRRSTWRYQVRELTDPLEGCCGGEIHFSLPPPYTFPWGSRWGHTDILGWRRRTERQGRWGGGERRERENRDGLTYREYIFGRPRVDRHHLIIQTTHFTNPSSWSQTYLLSLERSTQCVWFLMHTCRDFIDLHNLCGSSWPGTPSYPLTLLLCSSSQIPSFLRIPFGCCETCGGVWMLGCQPSSSAISPHHDYVNSEIYLETLIDKVWGCTWKWRSSWLRDALGGCDWTSLEMHLEAMHEQVWRCTWTAMIMQTWGP